MKLLLATLAVVTASTLSLGCATVIESESKIQSEKTIQMSLPPEYLTIGNECISGGPTFIHEAGGSLSIVLLNPPFREFYVSLRDYCWHTTRSAHVITGTSFAINSYRGTPPGGAAAQIWIQTNTNDLFIKLATEETWTRVGNCGLSEAVLQRVRDNTTTVSRCN